MNINEKFEYINGIVKDVSCVIDGRVEGVNGIYVDSRYFSDSEDMSDIPTPIYLVCEDKPSNYIEIEQKLNVFTGNLVLFVLGELEFVNNFKSCCTLVK